MLDITNEDGALVLKHAPRLEAGEPVGEEEYKKIIVELDKGRRNSSKP
jgi:hypothetical protein